MSCRCRATTFHFKENPNDFGRVVGYQGQDCTYGELPVGGGASGARSGLLKVCILTTL